MTSAIEIRQARRKAARELGPFARAMQDAMREYRTMRKQGVDAEDACKGLEAVMRDVWPKGRDEPWHYVCDACKDSGLRDERRPARVYGGELVTYKTRCSCRAGAGKWQPRSPADKLSDVAKGWDA